MKIIERVKSFFSGDGRGHYSLVNPNKSQIKWRHHKLLFTIGLLSWIIVSLVYYYDSIYNVVIPHDISPLGFYNPNDYNDTVNYLINTPGCAIPNYTLYLRFKKHNAKVFSCGTRAVFVKKVSERQIQFTIDNKAMMEYYKHKNNKTNIHCSYRFVTRSKVKGVEDHEINYTEPIPFWNGTKADLLHEVLNILCSIPKNSKPIYEDSFIFIKKVDNVKQNKWNVIVLGIDTMSRGRMYETMPKTVKYFQEHRWLDFRGYQKVGDNTFPNIMAILTGKNSSRSYSLCANGMDNCVENIIWNRFKENGYVTAYGEDDVILPDTFTPYKGFTIQPTDHYMKPLYLMTEKDHSGFICLHKQASGINLLNYAEDFANTYKNESFFGFFWMNSFSHNLNNIPGLIDEKVVNMFTRLNNSNLLRNTFIIFLSDHGLRFGDDRIPVESYYENRLPMLFTWIPDDFKREHQISTQNAILNQGRLITPYDTYETLTDILTYSTSAQNINSEACPHCESIFAEKSVFRTCQNVSVDQKWCSCHGLELWKRNKTELTLIVDIVVSHIQNVSRSVKPEKCYKCQELHLDKVLRTSTYKRKEDPSANYYVIAFSVKPGDMSYEIDLSVKNGVCKIMEPTITISAYNSKGFCVPYRAHRSFCVCQKLNNCKADKGR